MTPGRRRRARDVSGSFFRVNLFLLFTQTVCLYDIKPVLKCVHTCVCVHMYVSVCILNLAVMSIAAVNAEVQMCL